MRERANHLVELDLTAVQAAVNVSLSKNFGTATEAALEVANAMPPDESDFDRGLAAGIALASYQNKAETEEAV